MLTADTLYRLKLGEVIRAGDVTPMMVFPIGEWHSAKYPDLPLTEDLATELIANFEAGVLGTEPVVDSSGRHDTSARAAGWVKRVYLASYEEGDVTGLALWADVKWTALGAELLTDEQYRYGSVEIGPVTMNESGETIANVLRSLTLTNTPVLRIMPGVKDAAEKQRTIVTLSLSELTLGGNPETAPGADGAGDGDTDDPMGGLLAEFADWHGRLKAALKGSPGNSAVHTSVKACRDQLAQFCDGLKTSEHPGPAPSGAGRSEPDPQQPTTAGEGDEGAQRLSGEPTPERSDPEMELNEIAKALGLAEDATPEVVLAEAQKAVADRVVAEKAQRKAEAEKTLAQYVTDRHILPAQVDGLLALAEESPTAFDAFLKASETVVVGPQAGELGQGNRDGKTEAGNEPLVGDPAAALAEARKSYMAEHGLKGLKGIEAADAALHVTQPQLFTEYAAKLTEKVGAVPAGLSL